MQRVCDLFIWSPSQLDLAILAMAALLASMLLESEVVVPEQRRLQVCVLASLCHALLQAAVAEARAELSAAEQAAAQALSAQHAALAAKVSI